MEASADPPLAIGPGLRKLALRESAAGSAPVQPGATVRMRYAVSGAAETPEGSDPAAERARLIDEWQGQPAQVFSVTLGQGDALPSVETAVLSMTHGELARFVLSGPAASCGRCWLPSTVPVRLGSYPVVTLQCSPTTFYQGSYHNQWPLFANAQLLNRSVNKKGTM